MFLIFQQSLLCWVKQLLNFSFQNRPDATEFIQNPSFKTGLDLLTDTVITGAEVTPLTYLASRGATLPGKVAQEVTAGVRYAIAINVWETTLSAGQLKDMNNILDCAKNYNTKLPISELIKQMFKSLVQNGHSNDDHSAIYKEIDRINKL
mgnify:CR=1 FL=1